MIIDGIKFTCEPCLRGHRSANCPESHGDRPLTEVKRKGRPKTQCTICQKHRQETNTHTRCLCAGEERAPPLILPNGAGKLLHDPSHPLLRRPSSSVSTSTCSSASSTDNLHGDPTTLGRKKSVSGSRRKDSDAAIKPHKLAHGHDATTSHISHTFSPYPSAGSSQGHGHSHGGLSRAPSSASSHKSSPRVKTESPQPPIPSVDQFASSSYDSFPPSSRAFSSLSPPALANASQSSPVSADPYNASRYEAHYSRGGTASSLSPSVPKIEKNTATVPSADEVNQILASLDPTYWQTDDDSSVAAAREQTRVDATISEQMQHDHSWQVPLSVEELQNWHLEAATMAAAAAHNHSAPASTFNNSFSNATSEYGSYPSSTHGAGEIHQQIPPAGSWPSSASSSVGGNQSVASSLPHDQTRPDWPALEQVPTFDTEAQIDRWRQDADFGAHDFGDLQQPNLQRTVSFEASAEHPPMASTSDASWPTQPTPPPPPQASVTFAEPPTINRGAGFERHRTYDQTDYNNDSGTSLRMDDRCETITPLFYEPADPYAFNFDNDTTGGTSYNPEDFPSSFPDIASNSESNTNANYYGHDDDVCDDMAYRQTSEDIDYYYGSSASSNFSSSANSSKAASSVDPNDDYMSFEGVDTPAAGTAPAPALAGGSPPLVGSGAGGGVRAAGDHVENRSNLEIALSEFTLSRGEGGTRNQMFDEGFAARSATLAAEIAARQKEIEALDDDDDDDDDDDEDEDDEDGYDEDDEEDEEEDEDEDEDGYNEDDEEEEGEDEEEGAGREREDAILNQKESLCERARGDEGQDQDQQHPDFDLPPIRDEELSTIFDKTPRTADDLELELEPWGTATP